MRKYFGTDGVRGVVGEFPITPDFALRLGYAAGVVLGKMGKNPAVIIGKDTRMSGYLFESSLEAGFSYAGVDVYMVGVMPTPAIAYLTTELNLSAGVVISASHNPYTDNGIKFFSSKGTKLPDDIEILIEQELDKEMKIATRLGMVKRLDDSSMQQYLEFCKKAVHNNINLKGLTIVLDCANGATYKIAPRVFEELGATVIKLACEPDGININNNCGSTHPKNLINAVKNHNADLGIAFDGDGDRVLFIDSDGIEYNGDKLIYVILQARIAKHDKTNGIVGTVMTNIAMEIALMKLGVKMVRAKVGDRHVMEELNKHGWTLGGEASGHILCLDHHSTGDGIISALQVISSIIQLGKPLKQIVDWDDYPQTMINVKLDSRSLNWIERVKSNIEEAELALGDNGRVVVRASGTEPLVRVMVEAKSNDDAVKWANLIANKINS